MLQEPAWSKDLDHHTAPCNIASSAINRCKQATTIAQVTRAHVCSSITPTLQPAQHTRNSHRSHARACVLLLLAHPLPQENHALYQRLVAIRPSKDISRDVLEAEHRRNEVYRTNCATFKQHKQAGDTAAVE